MHWQTSRRKILFDRPLVMAILNVTPDSFTDGGEFLSVNDALRQAEKMIADGADIIDVGGESTRPGSQRVETLEEIRRTGPVIKAIVKRFDTPISIDTTKSEVAKRAVDAGAEIINDISGLRFDELIGEVAAATNTGLVLMHSCGTFVTMHTQSTANNILADVEANFHRSIGTAKAHGVNDDQIVLDVGIGFGKTLDQNLELLAKLDKIIAEFKYYPMLIGVSRKSFIGKILVDVPASDRVSGSIAAALIAVDKGANIIRAHDVRSTVQAIRIATTIKNVCK